MVNGHDEQDKEKPSFVAEGNDTFKCDLCTETFAGKPKFMHHKKTKHFSTNTLCANFIAGKCDRNNEECWFHHEIVSEFPPLVQKPIKEQVFPVGSCASVSTRSNVKNDGNTKQSGFKSREHGEKISRSDGLKDNN